MIVRHYTPPPDKPADPAPPSAPAPELVFDPPIIPADPPRPPARLGPIALMIWRALVLGLLGEIALKLSTLR